MTLPNFDPRVNTAYDKETEILILPPDGIPKYVRLPNLLERDKISAYDLDTDTITFEPHAGEMIWEDPEGLEMISVQHPSYSLVATPGTKVNMTCDRKDARLYITTLQQFWDNYTPSHWWGFIRSGQWSNKTLLNPSSAYYVGFLHATMRRYDADTGILHLFVGSEQRYITNLAEMDKKHNINPTLPQNVEGYSWSFVTIPTHFRKYFVETPGYQHEFLMPPVNANLLSALCTSDLFEQFLKGMEDGTIRQSPRLHKRRMGPRVSYLLDILPKGMLEPLEALAVLNGWSTKDVKLIGKDWMTLAFQRSGVYVCRRFIPALDISVKYLRERVYEVRSSTGLVVLRRYRIPFIGHVALSTK